ncbi:Pentatricopeptide repeat-containing protein At5g16860 [Linum grandiflorum]
MMLLRSPTLLTQIRRRRRSRIFLSTDFTTAAAAVVVLPPPPPLPPPPLCPTLLKHCKSLHQANLIHQQSLIQSVNTDFSIHLISTYVALDAPSFALSLLQSLDPSTFLVFWWNALIRRALRLGQLEHSFSLFCRMLRHGWSPDHYTFPFVLKASGELSSFSRGSSVHCVVVKYGFESNVFVCNAAVSVYGRCGRIDCARQVFDEMRERGVVDLVSWNSIAAAHIQNSDMKGAVSLFRKMTSGSGTGIRADAVSIVNVLPACASLGLWLQGKEVHCFAIRTGLFRDVFVGNSLVDLYAKGRLMNEASKVFDRMLEKDVVSWNAMVTGYAQSGQFESALSLFEKMKEDKIELDVVSWSAVIAGYAQRGLGIEALDTFRQMIVYGSMPNEVTLLSVLSGCASVGALLQGKETHCFAIKRILRSSHSDPGFEVSVINSLVDMYAKCKSMNTARALFQLLAPQERDVVTWTALIGGYAQHGDADDALDLFARMINFIKPNAFTISCALMACARANALSFGKQIHCYIIRNRYDAVNVLYVPNCLVDMYSKTGDIDVARVVFDSMKYRNAVSFTTIITGYGMHGRGEEALLIFDEMKRSGYQLDSVTFLVVLYACSHSGMVDKGMKYFNSMTEEFGIQPGEEHYACMVDLLGRAGRFKQAMKLIETMPVKPSSIVWVALLSGCRKHANIELAEYATNKLTESKSDNDGSYTLLSNIYADARRWKDVASVRTLMKRSGIRKRPGCSWVQVKNGSVTFFAGDRAHPRSNQVYEVLAGLIQRIKVLGYVPETRFALHDVDEEEKGDLLSEHSEKLALAFGILTGVPGAPIRITKNLRVCGDCHSAFTYVSMVVENEIVLRDSSRFHHFKNGACSCKGYW